MNVLKRPRLRSDVKCLIPENGEADEVILAVDDQAFTMARKIYDALVPLLDGNTDHNALIAKLMGKLSPFDVMAGLRYLQTNHALEDAARPLSTPAISIRTIGATFDSVVKALEASDLNIVSEDEADLHIILTMDYLHEELDRLNEDLTKPWLLVRPTQPLWLGPLFVPNQSACWECLAHRLRFNLRLEEHWRDQTGTIPLSEANARGQGAMAAFILDAIMTWTETGRSPLTDTLHRYDPKTMSLEKHTLTRRPQCPSCGSPLSPPDGPPDFDALPPFAPVSNDAGENTLALYAHHISPLTGIVGKLEPRSSVSGLHVYRGGAYSLGDVSSWKKLRSSMNHCAAGKGINATAAKAGALAETLEWYTLYAAESERFIEATANELSRSETIITPPEISHYSDTQYANREQINAEATDGKYKVPEKFDPDVTFPWAKSWSVRDQKWVYVPAAACCGMPCPFLKQNSNGNAAGPTLAGATVHGALEAIERDAIALWWYNFVPRPEMSTESVNPKLLEAMSAAYSAAGQRFWVLDITSDLGIPVAAAVSVTDAEPQRYFIGYGAHFSPKVAATRALTELNQLNGLLVQTVSREGRDEVPEIESPPTHLFPKDIEKPLMAPSLASVEMMTAPEQVQWLADHAAQFDLNMLVTDLTLPDIKLPVVKVLMPGLRHAYPELGPGRLHDVPFDKGWTKAPVSESQMKTLKSPL